MTTVRRLPSACLTALIACLMAWAFLPSGAGAATEIRPARQILRGPDLRTATVTPSARAEASASSFCTALRGDLRQGARAGGLLVIDAETDRVLCRQAAAKRRILASNMKLFTTATALGRLGPKHRFETSVWRAGKVDRNGVLRGNLYLVGGGDPLLTSPIFGQRVLGNVYSNIYGLVGPVTSAGIRRVTGRVYADASIFDSLRGVADSGFATSPYIGPLSGLSFNLGYTTSSATSFSSSPEKLAGLKLMKALEASGVQITGDVAEGELPATGARRRLGSIESPTLDKIANATNVFSINFLAETLMKGLGASFRERGTTAAGAGVVEGFAKQNGSGVQAADGSGLTRSNRASPAEVAGLLDAMRENRGASSFVDSLAVAGTEGTLADRMKGTAAAGRCRAKTGTISGVSALSGYCFSTSGKTIVFSILMNGVSSFDAARANQDEMAALIARR